jgi:transcriptional regulator with XRE-family HTH domain
MNEAIDMGIGDRVRTARRRLGWDREALAFHAGLSWSAIAQIESGRRRQPRPDTLATLAAALGVTTDYLVCGHPASQPMFEHRALLYESNDELIRTTAPFLAEAIDRGEAAIAIMPASNIDLLRQELGSHNGRAQFVEPSGWYTSPAQTLTRMRELTDTLVREGAPWVHMVGELIWEGRNPSDTRLWTLWESLLNVVFRASPVTAVCLYDTRKLDPVIVGVARATHPHTIEHETIAPCPQYVDPGVLLLASDSG